MCQASPLIRWVGGKGRLLPELLTRAPKNYLNYYEPFLGGAAMFFALAPAGAVLADANGDLIAMYTAVRDRPEAVIRSLRRHRIAHIAGGASYYYKVRDQWNRGRLSWGMSRRAASFIYLLKTNFNGVWRLNRDGDYNVPIGKVSHPNICDTATIRTASLALQGKSLIHSDYQQAVSSAKPNDLIYFDSPYDMLGKMSFTTYTARGFDRQDQRQLASVAKHLVGRGCHVMLSNNDTPFIRSLYRGFKISRVKCGRSISSKITKRASVNELIITGGPS